MRDDTLTQLVAELAPIHDQQVDRLELDDAKAALIEEIVASPGLIDVSNRNKLATRSRRRIPRLRVAAASIAAAALAAALLLIGFGSGGSPSKPTFAAAAIRVAQANPRLLVTLPGWEVTRADEFKVDSGEMAFSDGQHELEVNWYPARSYHAYYRDRNEVDSDPTFFPLLGHETRTVSYSDHDFATMLPPDGRTFVELRANLPYDEYRAVVESLRPTDVETWLSAMPSSVVKPSDRAATVDSMLKDIPLPPGFDITSLEDQESVLSRYQLGAQVTGAVTCEWLDRWVDATDSGDQARAQEAVDAMATSHHWAILDELSKQGDWPSAIYEYGDAIRTGTHMGSAGAEHITADTQAFRRSYSSGLGCSQKQVP